MTSGPIIKRFNVKENVSPGLVTGFINEVMDPLHFQAAKETFGRGIVIAVACTTHANAGLIVL